MDYRNSFKFQILKFFRIFLHSVLSFVFGLTCGEMKSLPPINDEILLQSATELAEKIRKKELKSCDVLSAYIARIKDVQPIINAVAEERFEAALLEARRVDELIASGVKSEDELKETLPLLGVPFTVKDHISVKGMRCTNGMVIFRDKVSNADAAAVEALKEAGAIPIATTNLPESCVSLECVNKIYGRTLNPYDTRRSCGGSSGGEGALIAAAGSVFGIGTDYGGSIRIPAFMNGVFGHKGSSRIVSTEGVGSDCVPEHLYKYNVVGPLCRYGKDLLLLMKILSKNNPILKFDSPVDLRKLKIYYADDIGDCPLATPVQPTVRKALKMVLSHFRDRYGITPVQVDLEGLGDSLFHWLNTVRAERNPLVTEIMAAFKGKKSVLVEFVKWCLDRSEHTFPVLIQALMANIFMRDPQWHKKKLVKVEILRSQFNRILKDNCVFICPTQPEPAPYHNESLSKQFNASYNTVFNVLLYPATHIPIPLRGERLPVGVQCVANIYNDRLTIAVAEELEKAFGGWQSPSPVLTR